MGVGILERKGFKMTRNLKGGSQAWIDAGLPVYKSSREGIVRSTVPKKQVKLPDRISAAELKRLMVDLPGTFEIVDLRPSEHFADYSLPGSKNIHVAEILSDPGYLVGVGPLILVDRDGSIAMAVGGVLSQKTERPVKVLYGGLEAYWFESRGVPPTHGTFQKQPIPHGTPSKPPVKQETPPAKKKAPKPERPSAGC